MKSAFDLAAKRHEAIVKEAVWGALARGALAIGKKLIGTSAKAGAKLTKTVVKNPMKALTAGYLASEAGRGAKMMTGQAVRGAKRGRAFKNARTF